MKGKVQKSDREASEIDELIEQVKAVKGRWHKLRVTNATSNLSWQELLDGKLCPQLRVGKP